MDNSRRIVVAMAEKCEELIRNGDDDPELPMALRPKHLLWMCRQIIKHSDVGSHAKMHRWIGFVQCGMMANHMLDLAGVKAMFDEINTLYGPSDMDLIDHLNLDNSFELEIGGEG